LIYTNINGGTKEQFVATKNNIAVLMTAVGQQSLNTTYTCYKTTTVGFVKAKLLAVSYLDDNAVSWSSWSEDLVAGAPASTETKLNLIITESNATSIKLHSMPYYTTPDLPKKLFLLMVNSI